MRLSAIVLSLIFVVGCAGDFEVRLGVPSASEFADPVPVRVADVPIGTTGATELGPDDRPEVTLRIRPEYRDRIREDTEFVLRRERFGTGPLYVEVIPGEGERVASGHHFTARGADLTSQARELWRDLVAEVDDARLRERMQSLRDRIDDAVEAGQEEWAARRPELEAESKALLERLQQDGSQAADDLRRWFDETVEQAEEAVAGRGRAQ